MTDLDSREQFLRDIGERLDAFLVDHDNADGGLHDLRFHMANLWLKVEQQITLTIADRVTFAGSEGEIVVMDNYDQGIIIDASRVSGKDEHDPPPFNVRLSLDRQQAIMMARYVNAWTRNEQGDAG